MLGHEMSQPPVAAQNIHHPHFAAFYTWMSARPAVRRREDPLRREVVGQAQGIVLEVGAGGGQNFPYYDPHHVVRVEASEPDEDMLAALRGGASRIPRCVSGSRAPPFEALPFPTAQFDSVVATLVFCSVADPEAGLREIRRVLKPGGTLLLLEHVRGQGPLVATIQDALVPLTTRLAGNCHWNRDTQHAVASSGFHIMQARHVRGGLEPVLLLRATRAATLDEVPAAARQRMEAHGHAVKSPTPAPATRCTPRLHSARDAPVSGGQPAIERWMP